LALIVSFGDHSWYFPIPISFNAIQLGSMIKALHYGCF